jgi:cellulose synthase operon protein C
MARGGVALGLMLLALGAPIAALATVLAVANPAIAQQVPAPIRRGYTLLGQGLVNDAIKVFEDAVRQFPALVEAKLGLAIALRRAGRDDDAWVTYQKVLAQEPDNVLALRTVGILGGFRSEWQIQGIEALTRLLALKPQDEDARGQRALLYGYQGRFPEALADYEPVLRGKPAPDVLLGAAQIYTYSGDFARALELFNRYRATGGKIEKNASIAYARALRGTGNAAQAIQILQSLPASKSTQLDDTAIQARSELAQAYLDNRQPAEALAVLDALRNRKDARLPLARALNEIGQRQGLPELLKESASLYKAELGEKPNPPLTLVREVADVLGSIPEERGFALQLYRQVAQQQPENSLANRPSSWRSPVPSSPSNPSKNCCRFTSSSYKRALVRPF